MNLRKRTSCETPITGDNTSSSTHPDEVQRRSNKLRKSPSQEGLEQQQANQIREGEVGTKELTVVTTDFGADCDDQKAVLGLIEKLKEGKEIAFIVNGPHPDLAAAAIAQKYCQKTGRYPLIATGKQFEEHLLPEDRIYSLVDGEPIKNFSSPVDIPKVPLQDFQYAIDAKVRNGNIEHFTQIVLAPLHDQYEHYNAARDELQNDTIFHDKWKRIQKTSITQFQRTNDGIYKGNNYSKSAKGIADNYVANLENQKFQQVYFDGAVAKSPEFLLTMRQPNQLGIQKAIEAYIALKQVPWLNMTEPLGTTPSAENMHVGMFTSDAEVPFGVHVSGKNPAGFGAERLMKEVCGIPSQENEKYTAAMKPIIDELNAFDEQVLRVLQKKHPDIKSVPEMRKELHSAMMDALQEFAKKQKIANTGTNVQSFKELFKMAGDHINAYQYMKEFKKILSERSPLAQEIINRANDEKNKARENDTNHVETMTNALGDKARAVMYDAVATVAARVILRNEELQKYFTEEGSSIINITSDRVNRLQEKNHTLYTTFRDKVVNGLAKDRSQLSGQSS